MNELRVSCYLKLLRAAQERGTPDEFLKDIVSAHSDPDRRNPSLRALREALSAYEGDVEDDELKLFEVVG